MLQEIHHKYILKVIPKEWTRHNPVHDTVNGTVATVIHLNIGERGYIAFYKGGYLQWDILSTSTVEDVKVDEDGNIVITTRNSNYYLTKIEV